VIGIGIDAALGRFLAQVPDACFAESSASSAFALRFFFDLRDSLAEVIFGGGKGNPPESGVDAHPLVNLVDDSVSTGVGNDAGRS
jgi:hypothetical protein